MSADGAGFGPTKVPTSAVANGTDRDVVQTEQAIIGPQGEKIYPTAESSICPVCGQEMPQVASQPGEDLDPRAPVETDSTFDDEQIPQDPDVEPVDDRDNMFEMLRKRA